MVQRARVVSGKRDDGEVFYKFESSEEGDVKRYEEERCRALALAAHGDGNMLPDDWRYSFIGEALSAIEEAGDGRHAFDEIELEADIYTSELTGWLHSRNSRTGYCDEAVSEGYISETSEMSDRLMAGQLMEKREVLAQVLDHLRTEAEEEDTEEEERRAEEAEEREASEQGDGV